MMITMMKMILIMKIKITDTTMGIVVMIITTVNIIILEIKTIKTTMGSIYSDNNGRNIIMLMTALIMTRFKISTIWMVYMIIITVMMASIE